MRYFTFRFINRREHTIRDFTIAGTHEGDCLTAAWTLLRAGELGNPRPYDRGEWRVLSVIIRPVVDLADALHV